MPYYACRSDGIRHAATTMMFLFASLAVEPMPLAFGSIAASSSIAADDDDRRKSHKAKPRQERDGGDDDDKPAPKRNALRAADRQVVPPNPNVPATAEPAAPKNSPGAETRDTDDTPPMAKKPPSTARSEGGEADGDDDDEKRSQPATEIVVVARSLDAARTQIDAGLGSSVYAFTNETIENRPGGETGSLTAVLLQAPGVTSSGNGLIVRGSPANQIRINNVIVPEAISDPADHISSRFAETTRLLTGTLPAQFGFAPAGVISVTTKNGLYQHGGEAELFGGTDGMVEPALEWAGSFGITSMFGSGNFEHTRSTIADASGLQARDSRNEFEGLGFADHVLDQKNRLSLLIGGSDELHHIGATSLPDGIEHTTNKYGVGTYQHSTLGFTIQASLFAGQSINRVRYAALSRERRSTYGTQIDASDNIGDSHTFRFGLLASQGNVRELERSGNTTTGSRTAIGVYAQDEWKLTSTLTLNPGVRVDWLRSFDAKATIEPRVSLVWQAGGGLSAHVGYSRFAAAPPLGETPNATLADERDDYVDAGFQQRLGAVTLGLDTYSRTVRNYLAEHATIGSAESSSFAFCTARIQGVELSATYARPGISAWANLSVARAKGRTIVGGAKLLLLAAIAAATNRYVSLANEQPFALSAGATQRFGDISLSADVQASSGAVWTLNAADPNGKRHSTFAQLGFAAVYHSHVFGPRTDIRLDATNLTNAHSITSDASSLEGGWTRRLSGRAFAIGIEQPF